MQLLFQRGRSWTVPLVMFCASFGTPDPTYGQNPSADQSVIPFKEVARSDQAVAAEIITAGDSSRKQRLDAIRELPVGNLSKDSLRHVQDVIDNLSLYRRMPSVEIKTDRRAYDYFIQHPDVAVSIWRAMEISQVQLSLKSPGSYYTDTKDGTTGNVEVLLRTPQHCLIMCQGSLQGPGLPKPIQAKALMHLQPKYVGQNQVVHTCDLFVCFPSPAVEALAKVVSPMSFRIADKNFEEISLFVSLMSNAMVTQPGWVEQIAMRMEGVPEERSLELRNLTAQVYVDAERRRLQSLGRPVTLESIMLPVSAEASVLPVSGEVRR